MKKTLLILSILATLANADYELFQSQTQEIGTPVKTEEVFFGEYSDFAKKLKEGAKDGLTKALFLGLTSTIESAGIGLVIGVLDPFVMGLQADQNYLKVVKTTDKDGKISFVKTMLIGDKNPSYSDDEIRNLMIKGEK
jgi:hypothetical protein